jgi:hypothetical protein
MSSRTRAAAGGVRERLFSTLTITIFFAVVGCQTAAPVPEPVDTKEAAEYLSRPLRGDPAALYRLRVGKSGGLRMSLLTSDEGGRLTISRPFGGAVSVTAWQGAQPPMFFDLREGCRLHTTDLERALGVAAMPLPQAVRLLGGRLPALADDWISLREDDQILIEGEHWAALVRVASNPIRVIAVEEVGGTDEGWRIELAEHTLSIPGFVRVENPNGRWAELRLVRLEWNQGKELPPLPDLPFCSGQTER